MKKRFQQLVAEAYAVGPVLIVVLCSLIGAPSASPAGPPGPPPDRVVFPTGEWPADVESVQAALDLGGTVLLKATDAAGNAAAFDFGSTGFDGGHVELTTDVRMLGETVREHVTTIRGGYLPVRGGQPVEVAIRGIHFDQPGYAAVDIDHSAGFEFTGNTITGVVGEPNLGEAIAVFISNLHEPGQISGSIVIADNVVAVDPAGLASYAEGILVLGAAAEVTVVSNRITDAHTLGITIDRTGPVTVLANLVVTGTGNPALEFGNGIWAADTQGRVLMRDNTVVCSNPMADGIVVFTANAPAVSGAVVEGNTVVMHGSLYGGISFYGATVESQVAGNRVLGDGAYALQAAQGFHPEDLARSNRFLRNDLSGFTASVADVFFDVNTRDNVLGGRCDSVRDLGVSNQYTCGVGHVTAAAGEARAAAAGRASATPSRPST